MLQYQNPTGRQTPKLKEYLITKYQSVSLLNILINNKKNYYLLIYTPNSKIRVFTK